MPGIHLVWLWWLMSQKVDKVKEFYQYIKDYKVEICRGVDQQCRSGVDQQSTVSTHGGSMINTVDPGGSINSVNLGWINNQHCWSQGGQSTVLTQGRSTINSVDLWWINNQHCWSWGINQQCWPGVDQWSTLLIPGGIDQKCQPRVDQWSTVSTWGGSMINTVDPRGVNQQCWPRADQQSTVLTCGGSTINTVDSRGSINSVNLGWINNQQCQPGVDQQSTLLIPGGSINSVDLGQINNQQCWLGADQWSTVSTWGGSTINTVDPGGLGADQQSTHRGSTVNYIVGHIFTWFPQFCHSVWHASSCLHTKGWNTCDAAMKPESWPWIWPLQWHKDDCFDTWSKSCWSWNIQWGKQRKPHLDPSHYNCSFWYWTSIYTETLSLPTSALLCNVN